MGGLRVEGFLDELMNISRIRQTVESLEESTSGLSFRAVPVTEKEVRPVLEKNCALFFEGLRECSSEKTAAALREISKRIGDSDECEYYTSGEEAFIGKLSSVERRLDSIRKDGALDDNLCRGHLHPFLGTADEMYSLIKYSFRNCDYYKPITSLTLGVSYFLWNFRDNYPESIKEAAYGYVCSWLMRYVEILSSDFEELMSDNDARYSDNDDPDGPEGSFMFLQEMVRDPHFKKVLDYVFSLLGERVVRIERRCWGFNSPLNIAVRTGNLKAFDTFVSYEGIRELIYTPRKEIDRNEYGRYVAGYNTGKIGVYPEKSQEMLGKLFSMNILIPGTEEARDAFLRTIKEYSPSRDIIKGIKHPSYFSTDYKGEKSPLEAAYYNADYPSSNYDLLVESDEDINGWNRYGYEMETPLIADAVRRNDEEDTDALLSLGADLSWHDRWGNNILHRLYATEEEKSHHRRANDSDLEGAGRKYPHLASEKNIFGRVPEYYTAPAEDSFSSLPSVTLSHALDTIFLSSDGRRTDVLFFGGYLSDCRPFNFVYLIEDYLEEKRGDIEIVKPANWAELESIEKESAERKGQKYAVIIQNLYSLRKDGSFAYPISVISTLLRRDNTSVIIFMDCVHEKLLEDITSFSDMNIFVSKTENELLGDILLQRSGATLLGKGRFIYRNNGTCFSIDSVPRDMKKARKIRKKGRIWFNY